MATTRIVDLARVATRLEHGLLGDAEVPAAAYWGIHTQRALAEDRAVADIVLEEELLTEAQLDALLEIGAMTLPARPRVSRTPAA